jgi:DNA-binding response OmpR family regulator
MATILVVDENPVERRILRMTVEVDDHRVGEAATTPAALDILRRHQVDLVLFSAAGGDEHAYDLIAQTRALGDRDAVQFVAVLEPNDEQGPVEAFMNGAVDILIRPFGAPDIRSIVARSSTQEEIDLRERLVGIQLEAYEMALQLQEQARSER